MIIENFHDRGKQEWVMRSGESWEETLNSISIHVVHLEHGWAKSRMTMLDVTVNLVHGGCRRGITVRAHLPRLESAHSDHMRAKIGQTVELRATLWTEIHGFPR